MFQGFVYFLLQFGYTTMYCTCYVKNTINIFRRNFMLNFIKTALKIFNNFAVMKNLSFEDLDFREFYYNINIIQNVN